ncbi:tyrosine-type recombinase/integrase [uncultured Agrobacterium sp.]|uniref:tyrosine-type recombinase/integrase n=1 Tax=uncultured Agrobacterium sp. TaxID=157277 RepID=UPI0025CD5032|nr:tyrosine-type recombinase/integrase [uncultured Agrobacterium sp.]
MRKEYLRDSFVSALPYTKKRYVVADADIPNFAVRVGAKKKTFVLISRFGNSSFSTRQTIGSFKTMSTDEARQIAGAWNKLIEQGSDPIEERERRRSEELLKERSTFESVMRDYIAYLPTRSKNRGAAKEEAFIHANIINPETNDWMGLPISQVRDFHVSGLVGAIRAKGAEAQAHKALSIIRTFFNWTMLPDRRRAIGLETNPVEHLTTRLMKLTKKSRTRHFLHLELRAYLLASEATPYPWGPFQRFLIETGQRRSDVARMRWSDIDLDMYLWVIPGGTGKPDDDHHVTLSDSVVQLLHGLKARQSPNHGDYVFSLSEGQRPISNFVREKARFNQEFLAQFAKIAPGKELRHWVWHDVRRTLRSHFSGFARKEVAEAAIGHSKVGLDRIYNHFEYRVELREAFNRWSKMLLKILEGTATVADLEHWERAGRRSKEVGHEGDA